MEKPYAKKPRVFDASKHSLWLAINSNADYAHFLDEEDRQPYAEIVGLLSPIRQRGTLQLGGTIINNRVSPVPKTGYSDIDIRAHTTKSQAMGLLDCFRDSRYVQIGQVGFQETTDGEIPSRTMIDYMDMHNITGIVLNLHPLPTIERSLVDGAGFSQKLGFVHALVPRSSPFHIILTYGKSRGAYQLD